MTGEFRSDFAPPQPYGTCEGFNEKEKIRYTLFMESKSGLKTKQ